MKRAQGSLELILLLAVSLIVVIAIISYSDRAMDNYETVMRQKKAESALEKIHSTANEVYREGIGSKKKIFVNMPERIENISVENKTIELSFNDGGKKHTSFKYDVAGSIPTREGGLWLEVGSGLGVVLISENISAIWDDYENCGNGIINSGEECDGTNFGGKDCEYFGYESGELECSNCMIDTSDCSPYPGEDCSDNIDNDLDGYVDCEDPDCDLAMECLPEECTERGSCAQCTLDSECTWCEDGSDGSGCYESCDKGRWGNCFQGSCIGDNSSCP
ncbi:MAG: class III signal peptide-containing protein [Nanoarchaeota archaeon]